MSKRKKRPSKIPLYAVRNVSEKVNAAFEIVKENWRPLLRLSAYVLVPISIVQGLGINNMFASTFNDTEFPVVAAIVAGVFSLIGISATTALIITLLQWYDTHDDALATASLTAMRRQLARNFFKCLLVYMVSAIILVPGLILSGVMSIVIPVLFLLFLAAMLPLILIHPIFLLEDCSFYIAFSRAFKLGYSRWGQLVGLGFTMSFAAIIMMNISTIPWTVSLFVVETLGHKSSAYGWKVFSELLFYVFTIVQCLVSYLGLAFFIVAATLHYTSVATDVEQVNIENEIENFENL
ncbi:MAG: hypothetical protein IJT30_07795 [Muribaculaceae bacterium]|nr:hypothetical protein [Muribaculaceae bacterium]